MTDADDIQAKITEGIALGLHLEHKRAFHDAQRWLLAELERKLAEEMADEAFPGNTDTTQRLLDIASAKIDKLTPQDRELHRYAIYLDAFDARLGNGNERPRLLPITVDERLAAALGTLDASQASRDGAVLTGRFEHQRELHRLLHEDDAEGEEQ